MPEASRGPQTSIEFTLEGVGVSGLPDVIAKLAYRSTNGELAWRRSDVLAALDAIAKSGQATLGGEVWVALGEGRWHGLVPKAGGRLPGVWQWDTAPRGAGEDWPSYCRRAARESTRAVEGMRVEEAADPEVRDRLVFNLTFVAERDASP